MSEAEWRRALREFRALLRTERFPEGSEFPGLKSVQEVTGVKRILAQQVLRELDAQGEIAVYPGRGCVVLPAPKPNEMDTLLAELDTAASRLASVAVEVQESASRVWQARQAQRAAEISEHRSRVLSGDPTAEQM